MITNTSATPLMAVRASVCPFFWPGIPVVGNGSGPGPEAGFGGIGNVVSRELLVLPVPPGICTGRLLGYRFVGLRGSAVGAPLFELDGGSRAGCRGGGLSISDMAWEEGGRTMSVGDDSSAVVAGAFSVGLGLGGASPSTFCPPTKL